MSTTMRRLRAASSRGLDHLQTRHPSTRIASDTPPTRNGTGDRRRHRFHRQQGRRVRGRRDADLDRELKRGRQEDREFQPAGQETMVTPAQASSCASSGSPSSLVSGNDVIPMCRRAPASSTATGKSMSSTWGGSIRSTPSSHGAGRSSNAWRLELGDGEIVLHGERQKRRLHLEGHRTETRRCPPTL